MYGLKWQEAEKDFVSFFPTKFSYVFQFHDSRAAMGATGSKRVFTTEHPSDFVVTHHGVMFYAEVKDCRHVSAFPFANVKKSQWAAAIQQIAAGGRYYFFIRHNHVGGMTWYQVPAKQMLEWKKTAASVKWENMDKYKMSFIEGQALINVEEK